MWPAEFSEVLMEGFSVEKETRDNGDGEEG